MKSLIDGVLGPDTKEAILTYVPPTIGRIVHYTASHKGAAVIHAATVIAIAEKRNNVYLRVEDGNYAPPGRPTGPDLRQPLISSTQRVRGIPYSPTYRAGHWSYPPRV